MVQNGKQNRSETIHDGMLSELATGQSIDIYGRCVVLEVFIELFWYFLVHELSRIVVIESSAYSSTKYLTNFVRLL